MWWIEIRFETGCWTTGCTGGDGNIAAAVADGMAVVAAAAAAAGTPKICWISMMRQSCGIDWKLSRQLNLSDQPDPHCWI